MTKNEITVGRFWNSSEIEIIEVEGIKYALNGWNGELWTNCWKVLDNNGFEEAEDKDKYSIKITYPDFEKLDFESEEAANFDFENAKIEVSIS